MCRSKNISNFTCHCEKMNKKRRSCCSGGSSRESLRVKADSHQVALRFAFYSGLNELHWEPDLWPHKYRIRQSCPLAVPAVTLHAPDPLESLQARSQSCFCFSQHSCCIENLASKSAPTHAQGNKGGWYTLLNTPPTHTTCLATRYSVLHRNTHWKRHAHLIIYTRHACCEQLT